MQQFTNLADATEQAIKASRTAGNESVYILETYSEDTSYGVTPQGFDVNRSYYHGSGKYAGRKMRFGVIARYVKGEIVQPEADAKDWIVYKDQTMKNGSTMREYYTGAIRFGGLQGVQCALSPTDAKMFTESDAKAKVADLRGYWKAMRQS